MNKVWLLVIVVIVIAAAGYFYMNPYKTMMPYSQDSSYQTPTTMMESPAPMMYAQGQTVRLDEQNDSGESGTAVLTEKDGKVTVSLNVTGGAPGVAQPAHIHVGSCPEVGAVAYPLTNVVGGKSETVLDVTLAQLAGEQPLGINVHKSAAEAKVYVACGDLNLPGSAPAASASTGSGMVKY